MNCLRRSIAIPAPAQKTSFVLAAPALVCMSCTKLSDEMDRHSNKSDQIPVSISSKDLGSASALADWLRIRIGAHNVNHWGKMPGTKRVSNLWLELCQGEIVLEDSSTPKRTVHVACVKIVNPSGDMMLVESHQEMGDGSIRERNRPLSEKMRPDESVEDACLRGIREELGPVYGLAENVRLRQHTYNKIVQEGDSYSYPGLPTCYVLHNMEAVISSLPPHDFVTDENEHCEDVANDAYNQVKNVDCVANDTSGQVKNADDVANYTSNQTLPCPSGIEIDAAANYAYDQVRSVDDVSNDACNQTSPCPSGIQIGDFNDKDDNVCSTDYGNKEIDDQTSIMSKWNDVDDDATKNQNGAVAHIRINGTIKAAASCNKQENQSAAVGVKRHFWKWIPVTSA